MSLGSAMHCEHANEVPAGPCPCPDGCYCRGRTCATDGTRPRFADSRKPAQRRAGQPASGRSRRVREYLGLLEANQAAQKAARAREDELDTKIEKLWLSMTEKERNKADRLAGEPGPPGRPVRDPADYQIDGPDGEMVWVSAVKDVGLLRDRLCRELDRRDLLREKADELIEAFDKPSDADGGAPPRDDVTRHPSGGCGGCGQHAGSSRRRTNR